MRASFRVRRGRFVVAALDAGRQLSKARGHYYNFEDLVATYCDQFFATNLDLNKNYHGC
jgi:hypothetical protein